MANYLEPLLAIVGFAFLIALGAGVVAMAVEGLRENEESVGPYRDGLDAAARISSAAFAAEHDLYLVAEQARCWEEG
jgi:hypothetical protein